MRHDLKSYITLTIHSQETQEDLLQLRKGFRELDIRKRKELGKVILPDNLFSPDPTSGIQDAPRSVLLIGIPGVGKTATMYHFLMEHMEGRLWNEKFAFLVFILLREIKHFQEGRQITFKNILFSCFGPSLGFLEEERVWEYLMQHQEQVLFLLDGFDEFDTSPTESFTSYSNPTAPNVLLQNLIEGNLLSKSHILL